MSSFVTRADAVVSTVVVYVHGLWLQGQEAALLRRRLATLLDANVRSFTYRSVRATLADNADALRRYLQSIEADTLHVIAHSLGGLVILKMFDEGDAACVAAMASLPRGRIVLLASPVQGSVSAQRLARLPFGIGKKLLGLTAGEVLVTPQAQRWNGACDLGVIAGDLSFGAGRLLGALELPNDGTVLLRETDLPGATEQLRVRVSHSGMPFSLTVSRQAAAFLRNGRFNSMQ